MLIHCIIVYLLYLNLVLGLGFPVCPENGVLNCLNDSDFVVSTSKAISNCIYVGCPSFIIDSSIVLINNVTFRDSVGPSIVIVGGSQVNISDVQFYNSSLSLEGVSSIFHMIRCLFKSTRLEVTGSSHNISIESSEFMDNTTPDSGGAIFMNPTDSTVTITNSLFARNKAGVYSGALHMYGLRSAYISNSTFTENSAMYVGVLVASSIYLQISGCQFIRNSAISMIGAIRIEYGGSTLIENTFFIENTASLFGAISFEHMHSEAYVRNCHFEGNSADDGAGSIRADFISFFLMVDSCTFVNNSSPNGYAGSIALVNVESCSITNSSFNSESAYEGGGSIISSLSDLLITNCTFLNCSSNVSGGVLLLLQSSTANITDTIFRNNSANQGAVIYADHSSVNINNCTQSDSIAYYGGSFFIDTSALNIQNSNFMNNVALSQGGTIFTTNSMVSISGSYFSNGNAELGGQIYADNGALSISNCTFDLNNAVYAGGFLFYLNKKANGFLSITSCVISNSFAGFAGGALTLISHKYFNILIQDCLFHNSSAVSVSGLLQLQSDIGTAFFRNCEFVNNFSSNTAIGVLTAATTYFTNCLFSNSVTLNGEGNVGIGYTVFLDNCTITGATSPSGGFASIPYAGSTLIVSNSKFSDITSYYKGGIIYSDPDTVVSFTNCSFESINAFYQGAISYSLGYIEVIDCGIKAPSFYSNYASSFFYVSKKDAILIIDRFMIDGKIPDIDGSIVSCDFGGIAKINQLSFSNSQYILQSIFAVDILSSITISDSVFIDMQGASLIKASSFSTVTIMNCTIAYSDKESSTFMDQVFSLESGSSLTLISSKISNFQGAVAVILAPGGNTINCIDSTISGTKVPESTLMLYNGEMTSINCSFVDNVSTGSVNECISRSSSKSIIAVGGAIFGYSSTITLTGGTLFSGNGADLGGVLYCVNCELIFDDVIFKGNTASLTGGAVWSDSSNVQVGDCQVLGNKALSLPASNDFFLTSGQLTRGINSINISIYVGDDILSNFILFNSSMISLTGLRGSARSLNVLEFSDTITASSTSDYLPSITVVALDVFNEVVSIDPNDPIIIQVSLEGSNKSSSLSGESSKLMATESMIFSDLQIIGKVPGASYKLTISSINRPEISPKSITVLFQECDSETQVLFKGTTCVPLLVGNGLGAKVTIISIYALQAPFIIVSLIFLYKYRNFALIQANSFIFLFISGIGCLVAISALPFTLFEIGCYSSIFLEKIGFTIVFAALILKVYRINLIFYTGSNLVILSKAWKKRLQDPYLVMILASLVVCVTMYLAAWRTIDAPKVTLTYSPELNSITKNTCDMNSLFAIVLEGFQFSAVLILSYFAYLTRGIPAKFNEAKVIGFACYNWLIFGSFFYLTAEYLINEPELKIILKAVSLYLSYGIISFSLITDKVNRCTKFQDPDTKGTKNKTGSINVSMHESMFNNNNNNNIINSKKISLKVNSQSESNK